MLSPSGAAGELVRLAEAGVIRMVVSKEVIIEADRVLVQKFPERIQKSRKLLKDLAPEMAPEAAANQIKPFREKLPKGDALILCAAHVSKVSVFVTWNTRDFMAKDIASLVDFPIVVPAECLILFRKWIEPYLQ